MGDMPRGPLPNPDAIRRNAPTIPTTELPASGRKGPIPTPPAWAAIPDKSPVREWWDWAWSTPEAALWSTGDMQSVVRLAKLMGEQDTSDPKVAGVVHQLEQNLGLSPKSKLAMRVKVVPDADTADEDRSSEVGKKRQERRARIEGAVSQTGS